MIQEIPTAGDRRDLDAPAAMNITWVVRDDATSVPGQAALGELRSRTTVDTAAYAFIVGESGLSTKGRRHLHRAGLSKDRITFSGFWKHEARRPA